MLILLFVLFVGLYILGSVFIDEYDHDVFRLIVQLFTIVGAIISLISLVGITYDYSETKVIDDMIEMYEEENKNIENQIDIIVKEYMKYENDTFTEFKSDSSITLVSLYPELKSDELVKAQIETYQENNKKLKELKEKKIKASVYKWWLYFGK